MSAAGVGLLLLRLPDTPRWYAMKNRWEEATRTLRRIDPDIDVDAELTDIRAALRPLESIRHYWENDGRWPTDTAAYPATRHPSPQQPRSAR